MRPNIKVTFFLAVFALLLSAAAPTAFALEESDIDADAFASGQAMLSYVCKPSVSSASNPIKVSYLFFNSSDTTSLLTGTYKSVDTALYVPINSIGNGSYVYALTWVETVRQVEPNVYNNLVYMIEAYNSSGNLVGSADFVDQANNKVASLSELSFSAMYTKSLVHVGNMQETDFVQHTITISFDNASLLNYVKIYFNSRKDFTVQPDKVLTFPVTTVKLGSKTTQDVLNALDQIRVQNMVNNSNLVGALNKVDSSIEEFQKASKEYQQALQKQLDDFFNGGGLDQAVESSLDKFKQKMEQEANDKLSAALDKIKKAMPVDIDGLQSSFDQLLQSVSTHDSSATLVFPGASVTLLGYDMQLWDDQPINFDDFFNLPGMQLLLLPLRFLFVFGMAKYLIYYFSKLEKLITLHTD